MDAGLSPVITGMGFGTAIARVNAFVAVAATLSVTWTVKLKNPAAVALGRLGGLKGGEGPGGRVREHMTLPKFLQSALWSYDLSKIDPSDKSDRKIIIEQILNYGTWEQVQWVMKNYSRKEIREIVKNPSRGIWMDDALNYWLTLLNIRLSRTEKERALFSLEPKFKI